MGLQPIWQVLGAKCNEVSVLFGVFLALDRPLIGSGLARPGRNTDQSQLGQLGRQNLELRKWAQDVTGGLQIGAIRGALLIFVSVLRMIYGFSLSVFCFSTPSSGAGLAASD